MSIDFTPLVRPGFVRLARRTDSWDTESVNIQKKVLRSLLERGADTEYGKLYGFRSILRERDYVKAYRESMRATAGTGRIPEAGTVSR